MKKISSKKGIDKSFSGTISVKTSPKVAKIPATFKVKLPPKREMSKSEFYLHLLRISILNKSGNSLIC